MKKVCISFIAIAIIILSVVGVCFTKTTHTEYLRIHIRANSNSEQDQAIKYEVKRAVVEFLTPFIAECDTKQKAQEVFNAQKQNITGVANKVLEKGGFNYTASVKICREEFPTRVYENYTLEQGFYDAIIINLGNAEGQNWWCVVYPPLCFTGSGADYRYESKIGQIIKDFFN